METQHAPRTNYSLARRVEEGITIDNQDGAANAWVYMAYQAVPETVIRRVLAFPEQRRQAR